MPGVFRTSVDEAARDVAEAAAAGLGGVILFGIPEGKDAEGSEAWTEDGVVQRALRVLRPEISELALITDVCLCAYTSHGQCGIVEHGRVGERAHGGTSRPDCREPCGGGCGHRRPVGHDGREGPGHPGSARWVGFPRRRRS